MASGPSPLLEETRGWRNRFLKGIARLRIVLVVVGVGCLIVAQGFPEGVPLVGQQSRHVVVLLAWILTSLPMLEWGLSAQRRPFWRERLLEGTVVAVTLAGAVIIGLLFPDATAEGGSRAAIFAGWWQGTVVVWAGWSLLTALRHVSHLGLNPAATLVLSFAVVVLVGTGLLMLPRATRGSQRARFETALFTSTSATCVTGLVVADTGQYWSRWGQAVILTLFQVGGLGIMTFGAFFASMVGRGLMVSESVLLRDLWEESTLHVIRRLALSILAFTFVTEAIGAVLLSGLWSNLPWQDQLFYSVFHAVSGFCNAGFSLIETSFEGYETRWQIWGALSSLIILGGIGFAVLYNLFEKVVARLARPVRYPLFHPPHPRPGLRITSRLVLLTSGVLLAAGFLGMLLLERSGTLLHRPWAERLAHCWFQSVTCRTAGFNTFPIGQLSEATQFFLMLLMFVGASPGSTGGGVKTVSVAITVLAVLAILRGRDRVEAWHRTIPEDVVRRALLIVSLGAAVVVGATVLLMAVENPPRGEFAAYLFEVTSAFATVGLSTGITSELSVSGQLLLVLLMFVGRVGPLTLVLALVGRSQALRYRYPNERVMLG